MHSRVICQIPLIPWDPSWHPRHTRGQVCILLSAHIYRSDRLEVWSATPHQGLVCSRPAGTYLLEQGTPGSDIVFKCTVETLASLPSSQLPINFNFFAWFNYGISLQEAGLDEASLNALNKALSYGHNSYLSNALAGLELSMAAPLSNPGSQKHLARALSHLRRVLNNDADDAISNYYMAIYLLLNQGDCSVIENHFRLAMKGLQNNEMLLARVSGQWYDWSRTANLGKSYVTDNLTVNFENVMSQE